MFFYNFQINFHLENFYLIIGKKKHYKKIPFLTYFNRNILHNYHKSLTIFLFLILNVFFTFKLFYSYKNNDESIFNITLHTNNLIRKINKYVITCRKGKLIKNIPNYISEPKISAIIIIYNSQKTIKCSIRSIQNQNMSDYELLLVDDSSTDDSLQIMEELQKQDKRIKIIKNKQNKGALYSRSIGTFNARAKYIMALDSDDLFINENIFNICYNEVVTYNLDILEFAGFHLKRRIIKNNNKLPKKAYYLRFKKYNKIIKQPMLFNSLYKRNNSQIIRLIDGYIWGKCIKKKIYIKALEQLGENIINENINFGEDRIVNFILFKIASSFKYINEYGIIYYNNPNSIYNSYNKELILHDEFINLMSIYNFTKNTTFLSILSYEIIFRWESVIKPGLNENYKKKIKNLINLIINSQYIEEKDKENMTLFLKELE